MIQLGAIEGHALWAPHYELGLNPLLALERRTTRERLGRISPRTVVDIACGTGQTLSEFQQLGSEVFGIDACGPMLDQARKHRPLIGRLVKGDARHLPFGTASADLVLCSLALAYFDNIQAVFHEAARVTTPAGLFVVSDMHPEALKNGWTRSFTAAGQQIHLEHHRWQLTEIEKAASRAGFESGGCIPVFFGEPERAIFRQAGKQDEFEHLQTTPALYLGVWRKPC